MKHTVFFAATVMSLLAVTAHADDITVTVNGAEVEFDQAPVIDNDRTLVPMRAIFEAIGAEVEWDNETRTVTSKKGETVIRLTIGSAEMVVDEKTVLLDVPAKIVGDRTMVPVRAISEALSCDVQWLGDTRTVVITSPAATFAPQATSEPTATEAPMPTSVPSDISDDVNIFDEIWISRSGEVVPATGEIKSNAASVVTDYIPINGAKSYYVSYYDPNTGAFKGANCMAYAFYDVDKNYISGANTDMAKLVKAPENASYIRFTIKQKVNTRNLKYVTFMQTDTVPESFVKSERITDKAQTQLFKSKKIAVVGDRQIINSDVWTNEADERLGANVLAVKGFTTLPFKSHDSGSLSIEKTLSSIPSDADYMIVAAGFWDWMYSWEIGELPGNDGGIYDFLETASQRWPNTKIIMMTMPPVKYAIDTFTNGGIYNRLGMNTQDYSQRIIEVCKNTGTDYIDISGLWTYENMSEYMKADSLSYMYPNEAGGKLIADKVVTELIKLAEK